MSSKRRQSEYLLGIDVREQQWQSDKSSTFLEYLCSLDIDINPGAIRQTSIICTIGKCLYNSQVKDTGGGEEKEARGRGKRNFSTQNLKYNAVLQVHLKFCILLTDTKKY